MQILGSTLHLGLESSSLTYICWRHDEKRQSSDTNTCDLDTIRCGIHVPENMGALETTVLDDGLEEENAL